MASASTLAPEPSVDDRGDGDRRRSWQAALAIALGVGALLAVLIWLVAVEGGRDEVRIRIPAGTGRQLEAGNDPGIVAGEIRLDVGDTLVVENDDDQLHVLGSLTVAPGQTRRLDYEEAGRFTGASSLSPTGTVTVLVR